MRRDRGGLTLTELLVAMSILLVGIYAVATGFPALFGTLESDRIRSEMARQAEARLETFKTASFRIPDAIAGHDALDGTVIPPDVYPDESMDPIPGNPRDDLTWVLGEGLQVPMARVGDTYAVYPLNLGPAVIPDMAAVDQYLQVYEVQPLQRVDLGLPLDGVDDFQLDEDGYLYAPDAFPLAVVDYVWADSAGRLHGVTGETVTNANLPGAEPVRAARLADFANVLPELSGAQGMLPYTPVVGHPADVAPGYAVLESNFGATLLLSAADVGRTLRVNYRVKTEPDSMGSPRRVPIMTQKMTAPTDPPYVVDLPFRGIDDENPLYTADLFGNAFGDPVYLLLVDTDSGELWTDAEDWVSLDFIEGSFTLNWDDPTAPLTAAQARGRDLRVYYRTIARHTIVVQKAPSWFVEDYLDDSVQSIHDTYIMDGHADLVDYRYYIAGDDPDDLNFTRLLFPPSAAGQMVLVDYLVLDMAGTNVEIVRRVSGELHTVPGDTLAITLRTPKVSPDDPHAILAVRGASMTVRGWWHDARGRVQTVNVDTFLTAEPLL
ncbi:MAG: type IV pilus modification PilV family protein [Armatimonadota bacterium]|jgi:prepilin-type N-terminal cleavage/methylation domain-containing protein